MRGCTSCSVDNTIIPSVQGTVTNIYRARLASIKEEATIKLTWSKNRSGPALGISINSKPIPIDGTKGSCTCMFNGSVLGISWDFSAAGYNLGPEPISDFYVAVKDDNQLALLVGDKGRDLAGNNGRNSTSLVAEFSLVSRTVQVVGRAIYLTKARFYDEGKEHDIMVRFQGEVEWSMHVDEKKVLHVRRLRWNFRGNETVFVDGLAVDVMWDLFRWLFQDPPGCAVVLVRTRIASGTRLWLEEGGGKKDEAMDEGLSLLIQVCQ